MYIICVYTTVHGATPEIGKCSVSKVYLLGKDCLTILMGCCVCFRKW